MNKPLRKHGLVVYQTSWGPQDEPEGTRLFSVLSVVFNPSDQWPLWACIVIGIGMLIHFCAALVRYVQRQGRLSQAGDKP